MNDTVMAALIGGAAGIVPVVITKVFGRLESRSQLRQQVQALDLAKKRVDFLSAWMAAHRTCAPRDQTGGSTIEEAVRELDEIRNSLKKVLDESAIEATRYQEHSFAQRLLLLYKAKKLAGWWWRVVFYMWTGAMIASVINGVVQREIFTGVDSRGEFSVARLIGEFVGVFILLLPSVYFRKRAVRSDSIDTASSKGGDTVSLAIG